MATYVKCTICGKMFESRLAKVMKLGANILIEDNHEVCPYCHQRTVVSEKTIVSK